MISEASQKQSTVITASWIKKRFTRNQYFIECFRSNYGKEGRVPLSTLVHDNFLSAIYITSHSILEEALSYGLNLETRCNTQDLTPLKAALLAGNSGMVHDLIQKGACVDDVRNHWPPLLYAAIDGGSTEALRVIINERKLQQFDPFPEPYPLQYAVYRNNLTMTKGLINAGCDVNHETAQFPSSIPSRPLDNTLMARSIIDTTILAISSRTNCLGIIRALKSRGARHGTWHEAFLKAHNLTCPCC